MLVEKEARVAPDVGRGTGHTHSDEGFVSHFNLSRMNVPVLTVQLIFMFPNWTLPAEFVQRELVQPISQVLWLHRS